MLREAAYRGAALAEKEIPAVGLLNTAYQVALETIAPKYRMGPQGDLYLFHTIRHPSELGGGDGHITNVGKMVRLYGAAVAESMRERGDAYPPSSESDPFEYHRRLDEFFRKYGRFAGLWDQWSSERKQHFADFLLQTGADGHDITNAVLHIDWEAIQAGEPLINAIIPQRVLRYEGSESQAADMVSNYLRVFRNELGVSPDEKVLMETAISVMIRRTKIRPNGFLFSGEPPDAALVALSEFDQLSATLSNGALTGGIGLGREYGTRLETEGMPQSTVHPRRFMPEWFLPDRFQKLEREGGPSMVELLDFLDRFHRKDSDAVIQFATIMEVGPEELQEIPNLAAFALDRLEMQRRVGEMLWPNGQEVPTDELFAQWTEKEFALARRACQLFTQRYWDASYTKEKFTLDLKK